LFSATDQERARQDSDGGQLPKNAEQVMVRKIYRNQSEATGKTGDSNVQSHFYRLYIEREPPPNFAAIYLDSVEVAEALPGGTLCFVRRHSFLNVGARPHLNVEAQFRLDLVGDFIGMLPGVNEIGSGFDPGHSFASP
jgi:hypothetical protein